MTFDVVPLKSLIADAQTGPFGTQLHSDEYIEGGIPVINPSNIKDGRLIADQVKTISEVTANRLRMHQLLPGDLVFARRGELGRAAVASDKERGWLCGTGSIRVRMKQGLLDPSFAGYALQSAEVRSYFEQRAVGSTMENLNMGIVIGLPFPSPSMDEQRRIADFLDVETARIERLNSLDMRLMQLLLERRQAVIDHEVDGSSETSVKLFWRLSALRDGTHQPPPRVPIGVPLLTARNVSSGTLRLTEMDTQVSHSDADTLEESLRLTPGDVLLSVKGTIGACAVAPPDFPRAVLDRNVALLRPATGHSSDWLAFVLRSTNLQEQIRVSVVAAAQPGLPLGVIRELRVPDVLPEEQNARGARVAEECKQIDNVLDGIERKESLLAERRRALITAAVTGQFDVTTASGRGADPS